MGGNALARFHHDVIAQPHASTVILMMGINDIGWPGMLLDPNAKAVNDWIRHSGEFDGVIDFDALARDQADPHHIRAEYNSGDNLHPNDAAYETMAGSIDLGALTGNH